MYLGNERDHPAYRMIDQLQQREHAVARGRETEVRVHRCGVEGVVAEERDAVVERQFQALLFAAGWDTSALKHCEEMNRLSVARELHAKSADDGEYICVVIRVVYFSHEFGIIHPFDLCDKMRQKVVCKPFAPE